MDFSLNLSPTLLTDYFTFIRLYWTNASCCNLFNVFFLCHFDKSSNKLTISCFYL